MPDWMACPYESLNNHLVAFRRDMASVECHFQAMKSINMATIQPTHKKGLISTGLHHQKNYSRVYESLENDIDRLNGKKNKNNFNKLRHNVTHTTLGNREN